MAKSNRKGRSRVIGASATGGISSGWFGYGEDGDLIVPAKTTTTLSVEEDVGQIVKHYMNLTVESGATLKPAARNNGTILLVKGDLVVSGTLSVDKCAPLLNDAESAAKLNPHVVLAGALYGGNGGRGGASGGVGGNGFWCGGGYGGGGGSNGGPSEPRPPKGITWPWVGTTSGRQQYGAGSPSGSQRGGRAPGGSGATWWQTHDERDGVYASGDNAGNAGDAYGGGALWIYVQGNVHITSTGKITANGGVGGRQVSGRSDSTYAEGDGYVGSHTTHYSGGGGSGGGGIIFITYGGTFTNEGSIVANGGAAPSALSTGTDSTSVRGSAGSVGTVKIIPFSDLI